MLNTLKATAISFYLLKEEKKSAMDKALELNLTLSEFIRYSLAKQGVAIDIVKPIGARKGNQHRKNKKWKQQQ